MCLNQYYTLNNTDLFVNASDGGLKLTYTDVNNLSILACLPAARFYARSVRSYTTQRKLQRTRSLCECDIDINKILLGVLLLFRLAAS